MPRKIVCAGLNRSGSTVTYNAVRCLLIEKFGSGTIYTSIIDHYDSARDEPWHIIKAHDAETVRKVVPDILITSFRDIRAVAGSFIRMGWMIDQEDQINGTLDNYLRNLEYLSEKADICLRYEDFCRDYRVIVGAISPLLGINDDPSLEDAVVAKLGFIKPLASAPTGNINSADPQTMLHHGHIGGVDNYAAIALLSDRTRKGIEERYARWFVENNYDIPKSAITSRLFDLERRVGPKATGPVPVIVEGLPIICNIDVPENFLHSGFHPEEWGAWSVGDIATLKFSTAPGFRTGSLKMLIGALTPAGSAPLISDVYLNGDYIDTWYWRDSVDHVAYNIEINSAEEYVVTFVLKGARTPESLGIGSDTRRLGMALREVALIASDDIISTQ